MTDSLSNENNFSNLDNNIQINDEIKLDSTLIEDNQIEDSKLEIKKNPLPMFIKNINISNFISYYKPSSITNNLPVPRLPTEEDILDELLDSVLSP